MHRSFPLTSLALALAMGLLASPAAAQPGSAPPAPAPAPAPGPPPPPGGSTSSVRAGVVEDANSGRMFASPTALTAPAGTWSFNDYELLFVGGSYAFTDSFSAGVTFLAPLTDDFPLFLIGSAKLRLVSVDRITVAAHGSVLYFSDPGTSGDDNFGAALVGGAATLCIDLECHSLLNGYLGAGFAIDPDVDQEVVPFVASVGYLQSVTPHFKLAIEGDFGFVTGKVNDVGDGLALWYGARITSRNIGVDLGFIRPVCSSCDSGLLLGIPWLTFTYRALPFLP